MWKLFEERKDEMRRIIAAFLALSLMTAPVSAITTGNWDIGTAGQSVSNAATQLWQEQNQIQEIPEEPEESPAASDRAVLPQWTVGCLRFWKWMKALDWSVWDVH